MRYQRNAAAPAIITTTRTTSHIIPPLDFSLHICSSRSSASQPTLLQFYLPHPAPTPYTRPCPSPAPLTPSPVPPAAAPPPRNPSPKTPPTSPPSSSATANPAS